MSEAAPVAAPPVTESTPAGDSATPPEAPPVAEKKAEPAPPPPKKFKVKIDAEEAEVDESELIRGYQRAQAANRRFQEAAAKEKAWQERQAKLKADPWAVLKDEGIDPDQAAVERVRRLMEQEAMSPEQRALEAEKAKRAELEAKVKQTEEERAKQAQDMETQKAMAEFNRAIPEAADKVGLPRSVAVGRLMVDALMAQARSNRPLDMEEAALTARDEAKAIHTQMVKDMDGARLVEFFGADVVKKILEHEVARVRGGQAKPVVAPPPTPQGQKAPAFMSPAEWRKVYG